MQSALRKVATVSCLKCNFGINESGSDVYDEFSHGGGVGDFGGFSFLYESGDEGFDNGVMLCGADGSHVEGFTDFGSAGMDAAQALLFSAVAVVGREPGQGDGLVSLELGDFREISDDAPGGNLADAGDIEQRTTRSS